MAFARLRTRPGTSSSDCSPRNLSVTCSPFGATHTRRGGSAFSCCRDVSMAERTRPAATRTSSPTGMATNSRIGCRPVCASAQSVAASALSVALRICRIRARRQIQSMSHGASSSRRRTKSRAATAAKVFTISRPPRNRQSAVRSLAARRGPRQSTPCRPASPRTTAGAGNARDADADIGLRSRQCAFGQRPRHGFADRSVLRQQACRHAELILLGRVAVHHPG